jgi:S-adenosylmethionine synthetase
MTPRETKTATAPRGPEAEPPATGRLHLFTSESVTEGHPDKMADQISDAVLDAYLAADPRSRVACEVLLTTGLVLVTGEITSRAAVDVPSLVRRVIAEIGYDDATRGFDAGTCAVLTAIGAQSEDIALGVDRGGAGDQGLMFGYACRETPEFMPLPIVLAHRLTRRLSEARKSGELPYLRPDGKSQVTIEYQGDRPRRVHTVVISAQHDAEVSQGRLREDVAERILRPALPPELLDKARPCRTFINPTGNFVKGGPAADAGLTGRKLIADTYGGMGRHGGGSFSGKDPTKVDRSACYAARHVAKNLVAAELCDRCEVQIAYAIGEREPVSVFIDTFGTGRVPDAELERRVCRIWDLTPDGIIEQLQLRRPIYRATAAYGHFGREEESFTWERTDRVRQLLGG